MSNTFKDIELLSWNVKLTTAAALNGLGQGGCRLKSGDDSDVSAD